MELSEVYDRSATEALSSATLLTVIGTTFLAIALALWALAVAHGIVVVSAFAGIVLGLGLLMLSSAHSPGSLRRRRSRRE